MSNSEPDEEILAIQKYDEFLKNQNDLDVAWNTIPSLKRANLYDQLDNLLNISHVNFPDHLHIQLEWAKFPGTRSDLDSVLSRLKLCSKHFPPDKDDGLLFITEQFLPLRDLEKWDDLKCLINEYWNVICKTTIWIVVPVMIFTLNTCGMHNHIINFVDQFLNNIDNSETNICGVSLVNAKTIALSALNNNYWKYILPYNIKILSIGQNCLPKSICTRWGLVDDSIHILPFDQSAFPNSAVSEAIKSDFSIFSDIASFTARPFGRHSRIVYHKQSGVHFAHNPLPLNNYEKRFRETIERFQSRIVKFNEISANDDVLFFLNICGECDLHQLIKEINIKYGQNRNIFILNSTHRHYDIKSDCYIFYLHLPYPKDYGWDTVSDYTSDRGLAFESHIISCIKRKLTSMQRS